MGGDRPQVEHDKHRKGEAWPPHHDRSARMRWPPRFSNKRFRAALRRSTKALNWRRGARRLHHYPAAWHHAGGGEVRRDDQRQKLLRRLRRPEACVLLPEWHRNQGAGHQGFLRHSERTGDMATDKKPPPPPPPPPPPLPPPPPPPLNESSEALTYVTRNVAPPPAPPAPPRK